MNKSTKWGRWLLALYAGAMLLLLFFRPREALSLPYWQQLKENLNYIPLHTIRLYLRVLHRPEMQRMVINNLLGNILLFVPLGFLLPLAFSRLNGFWRVVGATVAIMTAIELLQMFLLVGSCDIDDLLLNTLGAAMGYGLYRIAHFLKNI